MNTVKNKTIWNALTMLVIMTILTASLLTINSKTPSVTKYEILGTELNETASEHTNLLTSKQETIIDDLTTEVEEKRQSAEKHRNNLKDTINSAQKTLDASDEKVLTQTNRKNLKKEILTATTHLNQIADNKTLKETIPSLNNHSKKVDEDVKAWEAEQKRLEEERARKAAEEARRQQQATQQQTQNSTTQSPARNNNSGSSTSPSQSSSGSSGSGGGGGGGGGGSTAPSAGSGGGGGSFESKARAIMSRYCPASTSLKINDPRLGSWANGVADWYNNTILLRSSMPAYRLTYVTAHECAHIRQYNVYGGDVNALQNDMNRIYGGSGFSGLEQNADCMTRAWGITVYNYTSNCSGNRGSAARAVINGNRP